MSSIVKFLTSIFTCRHDCFRRKVLLSVISSKHFSGLVFLLSIIPGSASDAHWWWLEAVGAYSLLCWKHLLCLICLVCLVGFYCEVCKMRLPLSILCESKFLGGREGGALLSSALSDGFLDPGAQWGSRSSR